MGLYDPATGIFDITASDPFGIEGKSKFGTPYSGIMIDPQINSQLPTANQQFSPQVIPQAAPVAAPQIPPQPMDAVRQQRLAAEAAGMAQAGPPVGMQMPQQPPPMPEPRFQRPNYQPSERDLQRARISGGFADLADVFSGRSASGQVQSRPQALIDAANKKESEELDRQYRMNAARYSSRATVGTPFKGADGEWYQLRVNENSPNGIETVPLGVKHNELSGADEINKIKAQSEIELRQKALVHGMTVGTNAFEAASGISKQNTLLDEASRLITEEGATSGAIMNRLPSWNAATLALENIANQLTINVLNSVTMGALSATELAMAQATALPSNMQPKDLQSWIIRKKEANNKLASWLMERAHFLAGGEKTLPDLIERDRLLVKEANERSAINNQKAKILEFENMNDKDQAKEIFRRNIKDFNARNKNSAR